MSKAQIAVIIAARNAEATIQKAIRSALAQAATREVFVVDDASSDSTAAVAKRADDGTGRLVVLTLERNHGPAAARNFALRHSMAPYFCVLDADDYMLPGRLEKLLEGAPDDWDLIADDMIILPHDAERTFALSRGAADP